MQTWCKLKWLQFAFSLFYTGKWLSNKCKNHSSYQGGAKLWNNGRPWWILVFWTFLSKMLIYGQCLCIKFQKTLMCRVCPLWGRQKIDLVLEIHLVREIHAWEIDEKYIIWDWNKLITPIFDRKSWIIFWVRINHTKWISHTRLIFERPQMAISGWNREFLSIS